MKQTICHRIRLVCAALGLTVFNVSTVHAESDPLMLVPPVADGGVKAIHEFYSTDGALNLAYERSYPDRPSDFFHIGYKEGSWGSPYLIPVPHQNARKIWGVINLANGTPLLLMNSDNTDYGKIFNINGPEGLDANGVPAGSGLDSQRMRQILAESQRLFFSMQIGKRWSSPMPIPNSTMVTQTALAAGDDGSALVVFARDGDKNSATHADSELYATVYHNHLWSKPVQLTSNSLVEYAIRAVNVNGQYLVTWVSDKDGNLTDRADSNLQYAVISGTGSIVKQASTAISAMQNNPAPVLGIEGNEAVLLWTSEIQPDNPARGVWEARFATSWSAPVQTGLQADYLLGGKLKSTSDGLLLTFKDKGVVKASLFSGGKWNNPTEILNIESIGYEYADYRIFTDDEKNMWVAGAANVATGNDSAGAGLYVWHEHLNQDLLIGLTSDEPFRKQLGTQVKLKWTVRNQGVLPSTGYKVEVRRNNAIVTELQGQGLAPGEGKLFEYSFEMDVVQIPFEIRLIPKTIEPEDNNRATRTVEVKPDFEVRSVTHADATHFTADIIEHKGVGAPAVDVEFYLVEKSQLNLIARGEFDPSSGLPLTVQTNEFIDRVSPYQILVKVNGDRRVKEDNYSNNQSSYLHRPQPDFEITQFSLTDNYVRLAVRNSGTQPTSFVNVLLTDDPLIAGKSEQSGTPWFYKQVELDSGGQAQVDIPRTGKPNFTGEMLYAVVNPYGNQPEGDRNNNMKKISVHSSVTGAGGGTPGGSGVLQPSLAFDRIGTWCSSLQVDVNNNGGAPAIASRAEVINSSGFVIAAEALPVVMPSTAETITFHDISNGSYTLQLTYRAADGTEQRISKEVMIASNSACANIEGNDVRVSAVQTEVMSERLRVTVTVEAVGYELDYRKPLLRVPVALEIKQGITRLYQQQQDVYLAGGETPDAMQAVFDVGRVIVPDGSLQLTARIPVRDDETQAVNNVSVTEMELGDN